MDTDFDCSAIFYGVCIVAIYLVLLSICSYCFYVLIYDVYKILCVIPCHIIPILLFLRFTKLKSANWNFLSTLFLFPACTRF